MDFGPFKTVFSFELREKGRDWEWKICPRFLFQNNIKTCFCFFNHFILLF